MLAVDAHESLRAEMCERFVGAVGQFAGGCDGAMDFDLCERSVGTRRAVGGRAEDAVLAEANLDYPVSNCGKSGALLVADGMGAGYGTEQGASNRARLN